MIRVASGRQSRLAGGYQILFQNTKVSIILHTSLASYAHGLNADIYLYMI